MTINENSLPEELACDCGSALRRSPGSGWSCDQCGRSCSISGRVSIRDPEPYRERENLRLLSKAEFDQLFPDTFDWSAAEVRYLKSVTHRDACISNAFWDALGHFGVPDDNERGDEVS